MIIRQSCYILGNSYQPLACFQRIGIAMHNNHLLSVLVYFKDKISTGIINYIICNVYGINTIALLYGSCFTNQPFQLYHRSRNTYAMHKLLLTIKLKNNQSDVHVMVISDYRCIQNKISML